uniref:UDP-2,3-diacylglucosamine hydrolase n=1 Tax=Candidatus Methanogaster sp. ANME-2c ERB4 TaxID=2759911 RepID=A0A7G9YNP8_9EURY|nr:UDP-2,3-diacylglucosamine hydrolase [Methanosarcinales archaeon ANME-2c ERB4]
MTNRKCIAVSDVHLGTEHSNRSKFIDFLDNLGDDVDHLVLLGDMLDFWRRDPVGVLLENIDVIRKLVSLEPEINVSYVLGNHDFHLIQFPKSYFNSVFDLNYDLSLRYGETTYRFIHGYQLECARFGTLEAYELFANEMCEAGDDVGRVADAVWKSVCEGGKIIDRIRNLLIGRPNWVSEMVGETVAPPDKRDLKKLEGYAAQLITGTYAGEFLIYGHTHEPFVKMEENIANTGSWVEGSTDYLEIDAEGVTLKSY